ncbi:MAG: hypothetical protein H6730_24695 [Deltaproteobacteria bacterium]|nr:hypothetical protein [Deltaproteobacteria bacterium]
MSRAGWLALLGLVAACGYTTRATAPDGEDVWIYVPPVQGGEVDLDATARVEAEVRRAVARSAGLRLVLSREVPRLEVTPGLGQHPAGRLLGAQASGPPSTRRWWC